METWLHFYIASVAGTKSGGYPVDAGVDDIENVYGIFDKHVQDMREA
ncbi:hypothetical protein MCJ35_05685 [Enterocloster sp. OA13]|nr:hypothetical protein [Enterocloster sp. OA13]